MFTRFFYITVASLVCTLNLSLAQEAEALSALAQLRGHYEVKIAATRDPLDQSYADKLRSEQKALRARLKEEGLPEAEQVVAKKELSDLRSELRALQKGSLESHKPQTNRVIELHKIYLREWKSRREPIDLIYRRELKKLYRELLSKGLKEEAAEVQGELRQFKAGVGGSAADIQSIVSSAQRGGYEVLEGARFLSSHYYDGDSFYASHGGKKYIFRLYHVDCTEDSNEYPHRIEAQSDYFGLSASQVIELGRVAARFTYGYIKGKELTIFTKWEDAKGESQLPRHYAFVLVDGRWLSEVLVEQGLARIYGMPGERPDGMSEGSYIGELKRTERSAKNEGVGAWGM